MEVDVHIANPYKNENTSDDDEGNRRESPNDAVGRKHCLFRRMQKGTRLLVHRENGHSQIGASSETSSLADGKKRTSDEREKPHADPREDNEGSVACDAERRSLADYRHRSGIPLRANLENTHVVLRAAQTERRASQEKVPRLAATHNTATADSLGREDTFVSP